MRSYTTLHSHTHTRAHTRAQDSRWWWCVSFIACVWIIIIIISSTLFCYLVFAHEIQFSWNSVPLGIVYYYEKKMFLLVDDDAHSQWVFISFSFPLLLAFWGFLLCFRFWFITNTNTDDNKNTCRFQFAHSMWASNNMHLHAFGIFLFLFRRKKYLSVYLFMCIVSTRLLLPIQTIGEKRNIHKVSH